MINMVKNVQQSIRQKVISKNTLEFVFGLAFFLLGMRPALKCCLYTIEKQVFLWEWLTLGDSFWVKDEALSTHPLSSGIPSLLDMCRLCACCYGTCEFICASFLLCWGRHCFLVIFHPHRLLQSLCLLFHRVPWPLWGGMWCRYLI